MSDVHDLAVVGSGLAGLSAAVQAARMGLRTVVIGDYVMGGQILNTDRIDNYPGFASGISGADLVAAVMEQAMGNGVEFGFATVTGLTISSPFVISSESFEWLASTVIVATGGRRRSLGVTGEAELAGRGVSECATCDGALYRGQDVAVVGGGDAALDEALFLSGLCRTVHVVTRDRGLSGIRVLRDRIEACPNVEVTEGVEVEAVLGSDRVSGLGLRPSSGGAGRVMAVSGVFVCVGSDPATEPFADVIPADGGGHLKVDLQMRTEVPGLFAAGACRWASSRQLASVAGDGVTAAIAAHDWLRSLRGPA